MQNATSTDASAPTYLQIAARGYALMPQLFDHAAVGKALELIRAWHATANTVGEHLVPRLNRGQPNVYNLQNKDRFFIDMLLGCQPLERLLCRCLNDSYYSAIPPESPNYILRSFGARSSQAPLPLHIDSFIPYDGNQISVMQVAIMLEDSTTANGCTIVIPASHLSGVYANDPRLEQIMLDKRLLGQNETPAPVPIEAKAGDVVLWDSRLHHGTTANTSGRSRWAIVATFCRWWIKQHFNITSSLPEDIKRGLSPKQKAVLGFSSVPFLDETEGIDMKRGYDR